MVDADAAAREVFQRVLLVVRRLAGLRPQVSGGRLAAQPERLHMVDLAVLAGPCHQAVTPQDLAADGSRSARPVFAGARLVARQIDVASGRASNDPVGFGK